MFGADRLHIFDGGEVEFLIPIQQFPLIGNERHYLPPRQVDVKNFLRVVDEFFHARKLYPSVSCAEGYIRVIVLVSQLLVCV